MLQIGTTIIFEREDDKERIKYRSKVVEISENNVYIDTPTCMTTNRTEIFINNEPLIANFVAKDQQVYSFTTYVSGRSFNRIPMLEIYYPGEEGLNKIQRREFVRVEIGIDVAVKFQNRKDISFSALTTDISAGGCALILPPKCKVTSDMNVDLWIVLPFSNGNYYLKSKAKIIRVVESTPHSPAKATLIFLDMPERNRQVITRFCLETQIELRRRGMIGVE